MTFPRYIALCGWPGSGKDAVALLLKEKFRYHHVDDGSVLREAAPILFGCNPQDPYSQEGKNQIYDTVCGPKTVRWMLGELGQALEKHFSPNFMPYAAMNQADILFETGKVKEPRFVFSSVRKEQAWFYRQCDGLIIQVDRPGCDDSGHEFDRWDKSAVDIIIKNDGSLRELEAIVDSMASLLASFDRDTFSGSFRHERRLGFEFPTPRLLNCHSEGSNLAS